MADQLLPDLDTLDHIAAMADQLLPDLDTLDHIAAKVAVKALPDGSDFGALKTRELARPKGARPTVIAALDARLGLAESSVPSALLMLPELPITKKDWRGHMLYKCQLCPHKTFDQSVAYAHAFTHPQKKE